MEKTILRDIETNRRCRLCQRNQSVDATHVIANIAIPGTIGLIRQGIKAIMEEIETVDPKLFEELETFNLRLLLNLSSNF